MSNASAPPETPPLSSPPPPYDAWFELTKRGSTLAREVRGGLVTFFTMAYIIVLNPIIIGTVPDINGNLINGMPIAADGAVPASIGAVAAATALIGGILSIFMGAYGRFPIALAAGLGINAVVAYTIAQRMTWTEAMGLVFWEGLLITILVLTGFRKAVFNAVPKALRAAISVGIGLFIAFIGLVDGGVIRAGAGTPVQLGVNGSLNGWPIAIFVISLLLLIGLYVKRVKGAMLIAILTGTVLALIVEAVLHLGPAKDATGSITNPTGWMSNVPAWPTSWPLPDLSLLAVPFKDPVSFFFGAFTSANGLGAILGVLLLVFSVLIADFFDTMGT
ncbi:MAG: NCS2 family permease, partial [Propionicimonas sp.]